MTPRPTLEQVAARAGVSRATASRAVNGQTNVKPEARAAVEKAVIELGYSPNSAARSLRTQRADSIALVISESSRRVFSTDPLFAGLIHSATQELDKSDKTLVLLLADSPKGHERIERYVGARHVDGVIIASMHGLDPLPLLLDRRGIPVVCSGRPLVSGDLPYVDVDNAGGAESAVRYLLESGRQRIATVAGPLDMVAGIDRLDGYRRALAESDRRFLIANGDFTRESGKAAMKQILRDDPQVDAVFAASDLMALGAMQALREAGRTVPSDVAVIGFDDAPAAAYADTPLSTVRQPFQQMGSEMVRMVLRLVAGEGPVAPVTLATELILRDTTE